MIDKEFSKRYHETWEMAYQRGSSLPEELDRAHMLLTRKRKKELYQAATSDLSHVPLHILAVEIGVRLEEATFADGVRAAISWLDLRAKEQ